jgi:xanthine dehydrogenase iron-sulfur cluster and FAD-binding subunit A
VPASDFVTGYRKTACRPDELIAGVHLPPAGADAAVRWYKVTRRRDVDIATVSGAFRVERDPTGRVRRALLAFGGMAERPARARKTETHLAGKPWLRPTVEEAMEILDGEFSPLTDVRGSASFRRAAARNLLMKFWVDTSLAVPGEGAA